MKTKNNKLLTVMNFLVLIMGSCLFIELFRFVLYVAFKLGESTAPASDIVYNQAINIRLLLHLLSLLGLTCCLICGILGIVNMARSKPQKGTVGIVFGLLSILFMCLRLIIQNLPFVHQRLYDASTRYYDFLGTLRTDGVSSEAQMAELRFDTLFTILVVIILVFTLILAFRNRKTVTLVANSISSSSHVTHEDIVTV